MFSALTNAHPEDLQIVSQAALGLFAYIVICVIAALCVPMSRRAIRFTVVSGLMATGLISLLSGYFYLWHHYWRA